MEKEPEQNNWKSDLKLKLIKDYGFLLNLKAIPYNQQTTKYVIKEGESNCTMREDDENFDIVYSYTKYDYEGKIVLNVSGAKMSKQQAKDLMMKNNLLGMKVKERAWFNVCNDQVYRRKVTHSNQNELLDQDNNQDQDLLFPEDDMPIIEEQETKTPLQQNKIETESHSITQHCQSNQTQDEFQLIESQPVARTGFHYQIYVERLEYKNSDSFESKMKVVQQKKEQARTLFIDKKYEQASKIYFFLDSITSHLRKYKKDPETGNYTNEPFYTNEELLQLENKNINAKINYLKCFFKMIQKTSEEEKQIAKRFIDSLLQKQEQNPVTHFLNAKWLLHERRLDSALSAAKRSKQLQRNKATEDLIALIQLQKANKHKIKVKVPADMHV